MKEQVSPLNISSIDPNAHQVSQAPFHQQRPLSTRTPLTNEYYVNNPHNTTLNYSNTSIQSEDINKPKFGHGMHVSRQLSGSQSIKFSKARQSVPNQFNALRYLVCSNSKVDSGLTIHSNILTANTLNKTQIFNTNKNTITRQSTMYKSTPNLHHSNKIQTQVQLLQQSIKRPKTSNTALSLSRKKKQKLARTNRLPLQPTRQTSSIDTHIQRAKSAKLRRYHSVPKLSSTTKHLQNVINQNKDAYQPKYKRHLLNSNESLSKIYPTYLNFYSKKYDDSHTIIRKSLRIHRGYQYRLVKEAKLINKNAKPKFRNLHKSTSVFDLKVEGTKKLLFDHPYMSLNPEFHEFRPHFKQDKNKAQWDEFYHAPLTSDHVATKQEMLSLDASERYLKMNDLVNELNSKPSIKSFFGQKYDILTGSDHFAPIPRKLLPNLIVTNPPDPPEYDSSQYL